MERERIISAISGELQLSAASVSSTVALLDEDATIPFIARYRKERTGSLDEIAVRAISERLEYYRELALRKQTIVKTIAEQGKLTDELRRAIDECRDRTVLEDMYAPYKPKRRTRAMIAREQGLEPLADLIWEQQLRQGDPQLIAADYCNPAQQVTTAAQALAGARDIIAERISDDVAIRAWGREQVWETGRLTSTVRKDWQEKISKFQNYYAFSESLKTVPSHRVLAIRRGTAEGVLFWTIAVDAAGLIAGIERRILTSGGSLFAAELRQAIADSFNRLLFPALEREAFIRKSAEAEQEAITVFSKNARNLLLAPPAGNRVIMGIDPGFRTGCKVAVIDRQGDFQEFVPIYPHAPQNRTAEAGQIVAGLIKKYTVELIAIGNGTASKETEQFIRRLLQEQRLAVTALVVSEAGASVYSASEAAQQEFPELDVTVRGAISIARRLQDPLAELVKIDPKAIGVGQYQHDVNQQSLKRSLQGTVESCVNYVGVELNTASVALLSYVSGISQTVAENIVAYRRQNGPFTSRAQLRDVPRLGPRVFEQSAGFIRIRQSAYPLDNSAIHPETYPLVERIAQDRRISVADLIGNEAAVRNIPVARYVSADIGEPTLRDILAELQKPGRDPRRTFTAITFDDAINSLEDLRQGAILQGTVTNVTNFGAFVDIGVHQDGLIHISQLSSRFVRNPADVVSVADTVKVEVLEVDRELKRISLRRIES